MVNYDFGTESTFSRVRPIVIELARMTLWLYGRVDVGGRNNYLLRQGVVYAVTIVLEIGVFGRGLVLILDFNRFVTSHARLRVLARAIIPDARFTQSFLLGRSVLLRIEI